MKQSFIDYAMSVIVVQTLPMLDGLSLFIEILYAMHLLILTDVPIESVPQQ